MFHRVQFSVPLEISSQSIIICQIFGPFFMVGETPGIGDVKNWIRGELGLLPALHVRNCERLDSPKDNP